ncbi:hypothetical protein [Clostridium tagluense]|uniref:hypothetical protein n=1 Tax=Clostridium tagluense TaxID=360422 RepID=UPI001C6F5625|nr:hypothetical protein [Clostridium tagluense]MBW9159700.1 hypothetical protein [Clostridium tagluense]WLC65370.1 hypothetical protein KTC93_21570 [Clostridium tagluense]
MSNEALVGIIITVIIGVGAFFVTTKKNSITLKLKNKNGTINMKDNTIGNDININREKK